MNEVKNLLDHDTFLREKRSKSVKDLATLLSKRLGYKITPSNVTRCFREFEMDSSMFIAREGKNNIMVQMTVLREDIANLKEKYEKVVTELQVLKIQFNGAENSKVNSTQNV